MALQEKSTKKVKTKTYSRDNYCTLNIKEILKILGYPYKNITKYQEKFKQNISIRLSSSSSNS